MAGACLVNDLAIVWRAHDRAENDPPYENVHVGFFIHTSRKRKKINDQFFLKIFNDKNIIAIFGVIGRNFGPAYIPSIWRNAMITPVPKDARKDKRIHSITVV